VAIITVDGVIAGSQPMRDIYKSSNLGATFVASVPFYSPGIPCQAVIPSPGVAGAALTSYLGQIPFTNPSSGSSYLADISLESNIAGTTLLVDRLWHNSGLNPTSLTLQTVGSVAWPARDINGSTNGEGVFVAVELSVAATAGTPSFTLSYTNSKGVAGRTGSNLFGSTATAIAGTFIPLTLAPGDTGVQSIQSLTIGNSGWTSAAIHLVAYRVIAAISCNNATRVSKEGGPISPGFPRLYDNTVPFPVFIPITTTTTFGLYGSMTVAQG
jgi:hypothetical protein